MAYAQPISGTVTEDRALVTDDSEQLDKLRTYNAVMAVFHLVQAVAVFVLSNDFALTVTRGFLTDAPGQALPTFEPWFDIRIGYAVSVFFLISFIDHTLLATGLYPWYRKNLRRGINYARWWEYSVSASIMIVLIALLSGITDYAALGAFFGLIAVMNLCGLAMELHNHDRRLAGLETNWTTFIIGCIAGIIPWVAIVLNIAIAQEQAPPGGEGVPTFVYAIILSLFLFFNCFAINMWLQYRGIGPWKDYLFGEKVYQWLSLFAKGALGWQIAANTLI